MFLAALFFALVVLAIALALWLDVKEHGYFHKQRRRF